MAHNNIDTEDVTKSRKEVDRIYEIFRESKSFIQDISIENINNANRRTQKTKTNPKRLTNAV
jgi:hypothetical protein